MIKTYKDLLDKVEKAKVEKSLDISSGEDLSVGIMNLIAIEEHLFFTYNKTKNKKYLDLLNEIRIMRVELLKEIIKDYEGEVWCISKHLLSASMRLMEVGTKELKKGQKEKAGKLFEKSYQLYSLFWGLNLSKNEKVKSSGNNMTFLDEKGQKKGSESAFGKLGNIVQKALDCCRE
jgi:D-Tyr-tRNAtyr deacylase